MRWLHCFCGSRRTAEISIRESFELEAGAAVLCGGGEIRGPSEVDHLRKAALVVDLRGCSKIGADAFQNADRRKWNCLTAASGDRLRRPRIRTDDENAFDLLLVERQERTFILEQDSAFARAIESDEVIFFVVFREREVGLLAVEPAEAGRSGQNVAHFFIDGCFLDAAVSNGRKQIVFIHVVAGRHFEIEAAVGRAHRVIGRNPVRHHDALKSPLLSGHVDIEVSVLRGVLAVDEIVGIHDRADVSVLHRGFERRQINLSRSAFVDDGVAIVPEELGIVGEEMLYGRTDALLLHAGDVAGGDTAPARKGSSPKYSKLRPFMGAR